jgi:AcrR family transcriptional regulator
VAEAIGISAAALYRHYRNKSDILAAVLEEHHEIMAEIIRKSRAEASTALDALRRLYLQSMALVEKYCALPVIFLSDALWHGDLRLRELKLSQSPPVPRSHAGSDLLGAGRGGGSRRHPARRDLRLLPGAGGHAGVDAGAPARRGGPGPSDQGELGIVRRAVAC